MDKIDFDEMGKYFTKSARTLRRWEKEKPQKFQIMLEEFLRETEQPTVNNNNLIVVANFKGGVGKSTTSDALAYYLDDAVVFNIDITHSSKNTNAAPTVDYAKYMEKFTVTQMIEELHKKYRYVVVDTGGEATQEVIEVVKLTRNVIIPLTVGKRAREVTINTINTFFGKNSDIQGEYKIFFLFNAYLNKKKRDTAYSKFSQAYKTIDKNSDIKLKSVIGTLDYSDAISTAEEEGKSIFELANENRAAYKSILGKITLLCRSIENHFNLD